MAKTRSNTEIKRVNINLPVHIIDGVKDYADTLGINTTSAYIVLLNQALQQKDLMNKLPIFMSVLDEVKKLQVNNNENNL